MICMTVETIALVPHPAHPPVHVRGVAARVVSIDADWCVLRWKVDGAGAVIVPPFAGRARTDRLWQATCFEMFVAHALSPEGGAHGYCEFNFAPSERWAAYDFAGYRDGMAARAMARPPVITPRRGGDVLFCDVAIAAGCLPPRPWRYGLTAVIEEGDGAKSYWAIAHGRDGPDFHDAACHAAWLAAPGWP